MGKINIKFGHPTSLEEQELLSERAILNDFSIEAALCFEFRRLLDSLNARKHKDNFFDLIFLVITQRQAISPKISFDTYIEGGYRYPMMVLESDYLRIGESERLFISNAFIDELGKIYQTEFDYEYVGCESISIPL
jgi:hypothetical protein